MFWNKFDINSVKAIERKFMSLQSDGYAMAPDGNLYFSTGLYQNDFSQTSPSFEHLFAHELTHVYNSMTDPKLFSEAASTQIKDIFEIPFGYSVYRYYINNDSKFSDFNTE